MLASLGRGLGPTFVSVLSYVFLNCHAAENFCLFSFNIKLFNSSAIEQEEIIESSAVLEVNGSYFSNRKAFVWSTRLFRQSVDL